MPPRCDPDNCMLADNADKIDLKLDGLHDTMIEVSTKFDAYVDRNNDEHSALFDKTKNVVKVPHLFMVLGAVGGILGAVYTIVLLAKG